MIPHLLRVVDSHTGGEPTRVVVEGLPDLGHGNLAEKAERFRTEFGEFRTAVVCEPRGSDILVGALILPPSNPNYSAGLIFFNNVGVLGMCGHGTIGAVETLVFLGRLEPGTHRFETPVGDVTVERFPDGRVAVQNVPSYRKATEISLDVPSLGRVSGELAWGGNWFFLAHIPGEELRSSNVERLTNVARIIREALERDGVRGDPHLNGGVVDHIELVGPAFHPQNDGRNFVLCPGLAYDRSPCGTGTSAKLACLAADGKLKPGEFWRQESITGSIFEASFVPGERPGEIVPTIVGRAFITAESILHLSADDPLRCGLR